MGEVYDAYKELPGDVKDKLKGNPGTVSQELVNSQKGGMENASQQAYCKEYPNPAYAFDTSQSKNLTFCNYKIPDPIFNAVHPATVMVYVTNPNADTTDRMILEVTDSMGLYNKATAIIPPIEGGKGFGVPVMLTENYAQFKKIHGGTCDTDNTATVTFADGSPAELPCPQAKWMGLSAHEARAYRMDDAGVHPRLGEHQALTGRVLLPYSDTDRTPHAIGGEGPDRKKIDRSATTYWIKREPEPLDQKRYENLF